MHHELQDVVLARGEFPPALGQQGGTPTPHEKRLRVFLFCLRSENTTKCSRVRGEGLGVLSAGHEITKSKWSQRHSF